jgi:hypothetical protein
MVPLVEVFSGQEGRPARTTDRNMHQCALFEGNSLMLQLFVDNGHVLCRVKGPQRNVLIVRQQQENVASSFRMVVVSVMIVIVIIAIATFDILRR